LAVQGVLGPQDYVVPAGGQQWVEARTVPGLMAPGAAQPPATPPPLPANFLAEADHLASRFWQRWLRAVNLHCKRAFAWDLQALPLHQQEAQYLAGVGASNPTLQKYLVWRRSILMVMVLPVTLVAVLSWVDHLTDENIGMTAFGKFWNTLQMLAPFAMPISAGIALFLWSKQKASWTTMVIGWAISFLFPILLLLVPVDWIYDFQQLPDHGRDQAKFLAQIGFGLVLFLAIGGYLLIFVIAIAFGVQRACLRLKTLLPESLVPGLFLAAFAPVFPIALLPLFLCVNQIASNLLLIFGMLALMASPLVFVVWAPVFVRPITSRTEMTKLRHIQWAATGLFWLGMVLLLLFALTKSIPMPRDDDFEQGIMRKTLLGFTEAGSLFRPWSWRVLRYLIVEPLGRSLFTTILVADLFMRINVSVWFYGKQLAGSGNAEEYDRLMGLFKEKR